MTFPPFKAMSFMVGLTNGKILTDVDKRSMLRLLINIGEGNINFFLIRDWSRSELKFKEHIIYIYIYIYEYDIKI